MPSLPLFSLGMLILIIFLQVDAGIESRDKVQGSVGRSEGFKSGKYLVALVIRLKCL